MPEPPTEQLAQSKASTPEVTKIGTDCIQTVIRSAKQSLTLCFYQGR